MRPGGNPDAMMRGGQPGRKDLNDPVVRAKDKEVRRLTRKMVMDPVHRRTLMEKLRDCTLHPSMMVLIYQYAFGKPKETVEVVPPSPVRIVNQFSDEE